VEVEEVFLRCHHIYFNGVRNLLTSHLGR
jgi:hypothetical protein